MASKRINESPTLSDTIIFDIRCPLSDDCLPTTEQPWKVSKVTIYYIKRDYLNDQVKGYEEETYDQDKLAHAEKWEKEACVNPTPDNIKMAQKARQSLDASKVTSLFFYNEAVPVKVFGVDDFPAWLRSDPDNSILDPVEEDEDGNTQYGVFSLNWEPYDQREGDYFIVWHWEQDPAGDSYTDYRLFRIKTDTAITTVIPSHQTDPEKYINLLTAYQPSMFETIVADTDLTPDVLARFNGAIAEHFTEIEDLGNQLIDILDANVTNPTFLQILANYFNKKLRSDDIALWRRQIKKAIPLYKKKGTLPSLREALQEAGILMLKYTPLWQIISSYTWCEAHYATEDNQEEFILNRNPILPLTGDAATNFELEMRGVDEDDWTILTSDYVSFSYDVDTGATTMTWVGGDLSVNPINLVEGDTIKVTYLINVIPDAAQQTIETYIRTLPLSDQRDDRDQAYPHKNWNVRVIEEDDVMFDLVIPTRHPYSPDVVFGQIRTEFPFSENIYNMDEFNGSLRDSTDPCNIDKDFVDCCTACISSKFNLDVQIQDITNDRIVETLEIIDEYTPFQAILHTLNFSGLISEFVNTTSEELDILVKYSHEETVSGGNIQKIFQRSMERESRVAQAGIVDATVLKREALSSMTSETTGSGTVSNEEIVLYTPYLNLQEIGIDNGVYLANPSAYTPGSNPNVLEITSGSNTGQYVLSGDTAYHMMTIDAGSPDTIPEAGIAPYLDETEFRFRLSNVGYSNATNNLALSKWVTFTDSNLDFNTLGVKTQWDVDNDPVYTGGPWQLSITSPGVATFDIGKLNSDGSLVIDNLTAVEALLLGAWSDIEYELLDDSAAVIDDSDTGQTTLHDRATIEVVDGAVTDIRNEYIEIGDYCLYGSTQYPIIEFVDGETKKFYIDDYTGSVGSGSITIYRRIADDVGYVGYRGMQLLVSGSDLENSLDVQNGENPPGTVSDEDRMMENFLVLIYDTGSPPGSPPIHGYYAMEYINGQYGGVNTLITLNGPKEDWSLSGESKDFTIYRIAREAFTVPDQEEPASDGHEFESTPPVDGVNRSGADIISISTETATPMTSWAYMSVLNAKNGDEITEIVGQNEDINMHIEYKEEPND